MGIKQQKIGKSWERQIIDAYFKKGYYVEKRPTQNTGTVYDIQVSRKGAIMFIEAKHIQHDKLYYKGSGLYKKRDELDNFVKRTKNNIVWGIIDNNITKHAFHLDFNNKKAI